MHTRVETAWKLLCEDVYKVDIQKLEHERQLDQNEAEAEDPWANERPEKRHNTQSVVPEKPEPSVTTTDSVWDKSRLAGLRPYVKIIIPVTGIIIVCLVSLLAFNLRSHTDEQIATSLRETITQASGVNDWEIGPAAIRDQNCGQTSFLDCIPCAT